MLTLELTVEVESTSDNHIAEDGEVVVYAVNTAGPVGPPGVGHIILDEQDPLPQRSKLSFQGLGVDVTDDEIDDETVVTINSGGGGLVPATPFTTTEESNPNSPPSNYTFMRWTNDQPVIAIGIEGEPFARWWMLSESNDGLYGGDGTSDPYFNEAEFFYNADTDSWAFWQDLLIQRNLLLQNGAPSSIRALGNSGNPHYRLLYDGNPIVQSIVEGTNITIDDTDPANPIISSSSSGSAIAVSDEGDLITSNVTSFDFVGDGVTATASGDDVTITIPGGSGGLQQATPFTTTTMPNPVTSGDMTVMQWSEDNPVLAFGVVGDDFEQVIITSTGGDGIYLGDGTYDPYSTAGTNIYVGDLSNDELVLASPSQVVIRRAVGGLKINQPNAPLVLRSSSGATHDITVDSVPNLLNDGNAVGIQPATNPTAITDIDNPVSGSGTMRFVQFDGDNAVLALGQVGDTNPQILITSKASDGIYFGDGTIDIFANGGVIYQNNSFFRISPSAGKYIDLYGDVDLPVHIDGPDGLWITDPSAPLQLTDETNIPHYLTADSTPQLLLDGSPLILDGGGA